MTPLVNLRATQNRAIYCTCLKLFLQFSNSEISFLDVWIHFYVMQLYKTGCDYLCIKFFLKQNHNELPLYPLVPLVPLKCSSYNFFIGYPSTRRKCLGTLTALALSKTRQAYMYVFTESRTTLRITEEKHSFYKLFLVEQAPVEDLSHLFIIRSIIVNRIEKHLSVKKLWPRDLSLHAFTRPTLKSLASGLAIQCC